MKKAIIFGAGNIGRGFIGQLLNQSSYEIVFFDINSTIVKRLNKYGSYIINIVSNYRHRKISIDNVRAVDCRDTEKINKEFIDADIIVSSVGVHAMDKIAQSIAQGCKERLMSNRTSPLNILVCENMLNGDEYLRGLVYRHLTPDEKETANEKIGFVETSIGRMVPSIESENTDSDYPLEVFVEEYDELPVDSKGFKGEIPDIKNMIPFSPFEYYIKRKLFVHNMGHAIIAYLGYIKGYQYIWSAIEDSYIKNIVSNAFEEAIKALSQEYGVAMEVLNLYVSDLVKRFQNRALKDTVERVAKDPVRKLSVNDRFIGIARLCIKHGIHPEYISMGIAAGYIYHSHKDSSSEIIQNFINDRGIEEAVIHFSSLKEDEEILDRVVFYYNNFRYGQ